MARQVVDGERKGVLRRQVDGFLFTGLERRSNWAAREREKGVVLVTMRRLASMALHIESLNGQFPVAGQTVIPAALVKGGTGIETTGAAMDAHLYTIKAQRSIEREAFKTLTAIQKAIA